MKRGEEAWPGLHRHATARSVPFAEGLRQRSNLTRILCDAANASHAEAIGSYITLTCSSTGRGPEGNSIIYDLSTASDSINQMYLVRRARRGAPGGPPRCLTSDGSADLKWSPDGRLIAYCVQGQLRVIAPDGTGQRVLVSTNAAGRPALAYPIWSSDSQTIYYKAYDAQLQTSIWAVFADGGPREPAFRSKACALGRARY